MKYVIAAASIAFSVTVSDGAWAQTLTECGKSDGYAYFFAGGFASQRAGAEHVHVKPDACDPLGNEASVLPHCSGRPWLVNTTAPITSGVVRCPLGERKANRTMA